MIAKFTFCGTSLNSCAARIEFNLLTTTPIKEPLASRTGPAMLCCKKPVRVLRLPRGRVRALRSTEANKAGKKGGYTHRQIVRAPNPKAQPPYQSDHRRDLDRRQQDQEPLDQGFAVRLARTQNMEGLCIVPARERRARWMCRKVRCYQSKGQVSRLHRLPMSWDWSALSGD